MDYSTVHRVADEIRASEEYQTYHRLKEIVMGDETQAALIREWRKTETQIRMEVMLGNTPDHEDTERYSALTTLLYSKPEVSDFLLSEIAMHKLVADIMMIVTGAAELELNVPGDDPA